MQSNIDNRSCFWEDGTELNGNGPINEAWNALKARSEPASLLDLSTASIVNPLLRLRKILLVVSIEHRALMGTNCIEGSELIVHAL